MGRHGPGRGPRAELRASRRRKNRRRPSRASVAMSGVAGRESGVWGRGRHRRRAGTANIYIRELHLVAVGPIGTDRAGPGRATAPPPSHRLKPKNHPSCGATLTCSLGLTDGPSATNVDYSARRLGTRRIRPYRYKHVQEPCSHERSNVDETSPHLGAPWPTRAAMYRPPRLDGTTHISLKYKPKHLDGRLRAQVSRGLVVYTPTSCQNMPILLLFSSVAYGRGQSNQVGENLERPLTRCPRAPRERCELETKHGHTPGK